MRRQARLPRPGGSPAGQAGAWPVAGGEIEGDAGDGDIGVGEVAAIAPPHEAGRAGIHRLGPAATSLAGGEGVVAGFKLTRSLTAALS